MIIIKTYQGLDVASRAPALLSCCRCRCFRGIRRVEVVVVACVASMWWWWPFRGLSSVWLVLETRLTRLEHHLSLNNQ
jgi:hypothetical protein